jgi:uncharacterized membrane protein
MDKGRLEAFSDGVIAIIITIMVLALGIPKSPNLSDLLPLGPVFLSYLLSFLNIAIYWNNHHHLFQAVEQVHGGVLWANMHLLFWLSLIPFATGWMGENQFAPLPVALYGGILALSAIAYFILTRTLLRLHTQESVLVTAIGKDYKGRVSIFIYLAAIPVAFFLPLIAFLMYVIVTVLWLILDRRIEKKIVDGEPHL